MAQTRTKVRRRVIVHGRVQGVFFRDSTRREALDAGVLGWVRNNADGTVEAAFEGSPAAVERLVRWVASGPDHALVSRIHVTDEPVEAETDFRVF